MSDAALDGSGVESRRRGLLEKSLTTRFGLRLHMSLMLAAAFAVGFGSNFLMLRGGFTMLTLRWIVAYLVGYAVLFAAMRCWLAYVGVRPFGPGGLGLDGGGSPGSGGGGSGSGGGGGGPGGIGGGGGRFGGGGASTNFSDAGTGNARLFATGADASSPTASASPSASGAAAPSSGGTRSSGLSFSGGDLFDGDGLKLLVLIAVALALVFAFGGGIAYMIASAPHLLVDVAFGAAITSGVAPATRRAATAPAWQGSVWHATWKPVTAMLAVVAACGLVFSHFFPGVGTLGEAWTLLHAPKP